MVNFIKKNKFVVVCSIVTFFVPAHGITYNHLKYLRYSTEQTSHMNNVQPQQIKLILQEINKIGDNRSEVDSSVVADLQNRLVQCGELLWEYDRLLAYLSRALGKEAFQIKEIMEAIYRLKREREVMQRERDEAQELLGDLADLAECQTDV